MLLFLFATVQAGLLALLYYATAVMIARKQRYTAIAPLLAFVQIPLVGIFVFWTTWLWKDAALVLNLLIWLSAIPATWAVRKYSRHAEARIAAILWAVASVLLIIWAFGPTSLEEMTSVARTRFSHPLPGDNVIPLDFARGLLAGAVPSPLHGDWLSSDRPPLQTGLFLAFRVPFSPIDASYQIFGTALQMAVIPAAYLFLRVFDATQKVAMIGAALVFFAPVTVIHGTFIWPKLITAAFLLVAAAIHFSGIYLLVKRSAGVGAVVGTVSAGAMLSHGAAAFTLLAYALTALLSARLGSWRYATAAVLSLVLLYTPWMAYQHYVDPPGDRLLRWHFADATAVDDERGVIEATRDAYAGMTTGEVLERNKLKFRNTFQNATTPVPADTVRGMQGAMFFNVMTAGGLLSGVGLICVLLSFWLGFGLVAAALALNWVIWTVSIFNVTSVVVHHSSLWMVLMLPLLATLALKKRCSILLMFLGAQIAFALIYLAP